MKQLIKSVKIFAFAGALASSAVFAAPMSTAFTPAQQQALGPIIEKYLMKNPEILMKMSNELRHKQMEQMQAAAAKTQDTLLKYKNQLGFDKNAVTRGPADAPITLIEFFDYQCSACAATYPELAKFLKTDFAKKNIRVVYRAFPFFGPASQYAAKMVIAAKAQNKGIALHDALFHSGLIEGKLNDKAVDKLAASIKGMDMAKLKQDVNSDWVKQEMAANHKLTTEIHLQATPGFVFYPTNVNNINSKNLFFVNSGLPAEAFMSFAKKVKNNL